MRPPHFEMGRNGKDRPQMTDDDDDDDDDDDNDDYRDDDKVRKGPGKVLFEYYLLYMLHPFVAFKY